MLACWLAAETLQDAAYSPYMLQGRKICLRRPCNFGEEVLPACRVWNDGKTQLILLCPRARQASAATASALRSTEQLARTSSSKLVSCGSLMPWMPQEHPSSRPAWASTDDGDQY